MAQVPEAVQATIPMDRVTNGERGSPREGVVGEDRVHHQCREHGPRPRRVEVGGRRGRGREQAGGDRPPDRVKGLVGALRASKIAPLDIEKALKRAQHFGIEGDPITSFSAQTRDIYGMATQLGKLAQKEGDDPGEQASASGRARDVGSGGGAFGGEEVL